MATQEDMERLQNEVKELTKLVQYFQLSIANLRDDNKALEEKLKDANHKDSGSLHLDKKDLPRPEQFKGDKTKFVEWMDSFLDLVSSYGEDVVRLTKWAISRKGENATITDEIMEVWSEEHQWDHSWQKVSHCIQNLLLTYTSGEPRSIVRSTKGNGAESMRLLAKRFDPCTEFSEVALQTQLLAPQQVTNLGDLLPAIQRWEERESRYRDITNEVIPERLRRGALIRMCPSALADYLQLNANRIGTEYHAIKAEINTYVVQKDTMLTGKSVHAVDEGTEQWMAQKT